VTDIHRNLSLLSVAFIAVHVLTAVLDTFVSIPLAAGIIPFASGYERLWLGLGAISLDLMLAMIVTSLLRGRLNRVLWRAIHLLAYLSWPIAFAHSIGSSKDLQQGWMLYMAVGCALIVAAAVIWRLAHAARQVPRAGRVAAVFAQHTAHAARTARRAASR
jgi:methionine sulfoxide reductase heme-binding subunit